MVVGVLWLFLWLFLLLFRTRSFNKVSISTSSKTTNNCWPSRAPQKVHLLRARTRRPNGRVDLACFMSISFTYFGPTCLMSTCTCPSRIKEGHCGPFMPKSRVSPGTLWTSLNAMQNLVQNFQLLPPNSLHLLQARRKQAQTLKQFLRGQPAHKQHHAKAASKTAPWLRNDACNISRGEASQTKPPKNATDIQAERSSSSSIAREEVPRGLEVKPCTRPLVTEVFESSLITARQNL